MDHFLLALDTATSCTTVALLDGDMLLGEIHQTSKNHSGTLFSIMDRLLREVGVDGSMLKAVAVGVGPGSFTGVRVGLAAAKGLAFALGIPLLGVSTLRALAENVYALEAGLVCPMLDALKGEVYSAGYGFKASGGCKEVVPEAARKPQYFAQHLTKENVSCVLVGSGALRYRDIWVESLASFAVIPEQEELHRVSAVTIARLALKRLDEAGEDDLKTLEPNYCRLSEAELMRVRCKKTTEEGS